jgi:hypothetical protein
MMPKPVPLGSLEGREFIPQAIIGFPISLFAEKLRASISRDHDDLDAYEAIAMVTNGGELVELKHYAGYPKDTTTVYLSEMINDVDQISAIIRTVAFELEIPAGKIIWQRADDPSL